MKPDGGGLPAKNKCKASRVLHLTFWHRAARHTLLAFSVTSESKEYKAKNLIKLRTFPALDETIAEVAS